jgi:hypothetical protein
VNLFKGYKAAADNRFVLYIEGKEEDYNEGNDITPDAVMELAESKYKILVENNIWKQPLAADRQIVALTAQIQKMEMGKPKRRHQQNASRTMRRRNFLILEMPNGFLYRPLKGNRLRNKRGERTGGGAQIMPTVASGFAMIPFIANNQRGHLKRLLQLLQRRRRRRPNLV